MVLCKDSCQVRRTGSCKWNHQICWMQSLLSLCKFHQAFIDTGGCIFSYTVRSSTQWRIQKSFSVHWVWRYIFSSFVPCFGVLVFILVIDIFLLSWCQELVLKQPRRLTGWDPLCCCCFALHLIYPHLTGNSNKRGAKWQTHLCQYPHAGFSMVVFAVQIKLQEIMQVH